MMNETQVREAIQHLQDAMRGAPDSAAGMEMVMRTAVILDVLGWVLGNDSAFGVVLEHCRFIDRERQEEAARHVVPN